MNMDVKVEHHPSDIWAPLLRSLRQHSTLALSIGYLVLIAIGILFNWMFYFQFGINILDYSDVSDFLLGAFRDLKVVVYVLGTAAVVVVIRQLYWWSFSDYPQLLGRAQRHNKWAAQLIYGIIYLIITIEAAYIYESSVASKIIKDNQGTRVEVILCSITAIKGEQPFLLGMNSRFVFLYYPETQQTQVVPHNAICRLNFDQKK